MPIGIDTPTYLTVDEAAALLRVHVRTIQNRIRSGRLPAKRIVGGKAVIVDQRDVLSLLEDASVDNDKWHPKPKPSPQKNSAQAA